MRFGFSCDKKLNHVKKNFYVIAAMVRPSMTLAYNVAAV